MINVQCYRHFSESDWRLEVIGWYNRWNRSSKSLATSVSAHFWLRDYLFVRAAHVRRTLPFIRTKKPYVQKIHTIQKYPLSTLQALSPRP